MVTNQSSKDKDLENIERCLRNLISLKDYKDVHGKDALYIKHHPQVWEQAYLAVGRSPANIKPPKEENTKLPKYKKEDDIFWEVRRNYCAVSNWTYGPIKDWDEDRIKTAVRILDNSITKMLNHVNGSKLKDHEIANLVNKLTTVSIEYVHTQQLREQLRKVVLKSLER